MNRAGRTALPGAALVAGLLMQLPSVAFAAVPMPTCADGSGSTTCTYVYTGVRQTFSVPAGMTQVTVTAEGGHGAASSNGAAGGAGAVVTATYAVTDGEVLTVLVGGDGGSGGSNFCGAKTARGCGGSGAGSGGSTYYGGGGGGGSSVTTTDGSTVTTLAVAGGGGGGGTRQSCPNAGAGGVGGDGGAGGATAPDCAGPGLSVGGGGGGGAGTATAGGSGGLPAIVTSDGKLDLNCQRGTAGLASAGADGATSTDIQVPEAGAGGGGWYGGGTGGAGQYCNASDDVLYAAGAGGGGGGSSHVDSSATATPVVGTSGRAVGQNGQVQVSYRTPDNTPPAISYQVSGTPGSHGWYTGDVSLAWTVSEPESPASLSATGCNDQSITTDQPWTTYSCAASSTGGSAGPVNVTIRRDATAPTQVTGAPTTQPDGANGWYRTPLSVSFTGQDTTSGIASCTTPGYNGPDGAGVTVSGSCTDQAGNTTTAASTAFNYDATSPTLTPVVSPNPVLLHGPVNAVPGARDATAGVAAASCGTVSTATAGATNVSCTATDQAGNSAARTVPYVVQYVMSTLQSPAAKSSWKAGSTVPVKVQLTDATGRPIPASEAAGLGCRVKFTAAGAQTAIGCLTYSSTSQQFQYNWKLGSATGPATVTVAVSYPGTTTTTSRFTPISITR